MTPAVAIAAAASLVVALAPLVSSVPDGGLTATDSGGTRPSKSTDGVLAGMWAQQLGQQAEVASLEEAAVEPESNWSEPIASYEPTVAPGWMWAAVDITPEDLDDDGMDHEEEPL